MEPMTFFSRIAPGKIDEKEGIIHGVSVITGGIKARGHDLICDDETIREMHAACTSKGKIQVKGDHKSGIHSVGGFINNFQIIDCPTGLKLIGDWHLLAKSPHTPLFLEMAEKMPDSIGLSASFTSPKGKEKGEQTKFGRAARVQECISIDAVTSPAANPTGLFSAVDTTNSSMNTEEMLAKILANQTELQAEVAGIREFNDNLVAEREAYEAAAAEQEEESEEQEEEQEEEEQARGEEDPRDVLLARAMERIEQLEARAEGEDEEAEAEVSAQAFGMLKQKMTLLAAQRDEALAELESFRTPRVSASTEGVRTFSRGAAGQSAFQEHISQFKAGSQEQRDAIKEFIAENPDLYKQHLESREAVASM